MQVPGAAHKYLPVFAVLALFGIYNIYKSLGSIPEPRSNTGLFELQNKLKPKRFKVLALGGTRTEAINLPHPTHSFTHILGFPPRNILVSSVTSTESNPLCVTDHKLNKWNADVILIEFPFTGAEMLSKNVESAVKGMEVLINQLRARYPKAIFIYIHIYSLQSTLVHRTDGLTPLDRSSFSHQDDYVWGGKGFKINEELINDMGRIMNAIGGFVYALPRTPDMTDVAYYFDEDWHHLTQEAHNEIAEGILKILVTATASYERGDAVGKVDASLVCSDE
mmetsp:Transcript_45369/g.55050  ORF Transcript_45369/g.55050 Transcript_45369/m.55050 type:complete len:279 (+) Transcript_45369:114-950(+)|eukprot:CAMPEP_0172499088 /NCGR_PEP_ID=MMETSP1066-20121228/121871_1 /TAXON_ID=671091 /ORGANISM="Coscinodiscus wailesii, Strain CCMP2513" /LENGTH=278 /DNA_ID=CAMNT_0013272645 /DNA_START=47 /DNA_END=883 /DNA_ORIENTATION=+